MSKIKTSDLFVILETAQFSKDDFHHRNRLRNNSSEGYKWLTVPVEKKRIPIGEIAIDSMQEIKGMRWQSFHLETIENLYSGAPYFKSHEEFISSLYAKNWDRLLDLNMAIIRYLMKVFDIDTPLVMSSQLKCISGYDCRQQPEDWARDKESFSNGDSAVADAHYIKNYRATMRIVEICKEAGATVYLSGVSGKDYMLESLFEKEGLGVEYPCFRHPVYRQRFAPFIPNMSAMDYIMNADADKAIL